MSKERFVAQPTKEGGIRSVLFLQNNVDSRIRCDQSANEALGTTDRNAVRCPCCACGSRTDRGAAMYGPVSKFTPRAQSGQWIAKIAH